MNKAAPDRTMKPVSLLAFVGRGISLLTGVCLATVAAANDDPTPFNKFARESGEELVVTALGMTPWGEIPVAVFKGADFTRKVGDLAIKREDEVVQGEMILINRDAARLKTLHDKGESLADSLEAQIIKDRLQLLVREMNSGDQNSIGHIADMVEKHWGSVVSSLAIDKCIGRASKWFLSESVGGRLFRRIFPARKLTRGFTWGKQSSFRFDGWKLLGTRAHRVNNYAEMLAEKMADYEVRKMMKGIISSGADHSLEKLYEEALRDHPSRLVLQYRTERVFAVQPVMVQPLAVRALPMAIPVVAVAVARDPVIRAVVQQNYYHEASERWSVPSSQPATAPGVNRPAAPPPDPPVKTAREIQMHEEWMRVGDGKTFQIGPLANHSSTWDGKRGSNLKN